MPQNRPERRLTASERLALVQAELWAHAHRTATLEPPKWQQGRYAAWVLIQEHGAPFSTSDLIGPTSTVAERRQCLRAIERLEAAGLLECFRLRGSRVTHVQTTEAGRKVAEQLLDTGDYPPIWLWEEEL